MAKKSYASIYKAYRLQVFLLVCLLLFVTNLVLIKLPIPDNAWSHGFAHPLEGLDHIVTMIAVGIWAAQLRGYAVWLLPLVFVSVMSLGGIAGAAGILLPAVESIILLSCAVFSLFIIRRIKFSSRINLLIVAFFAFFHGFAHGHEISASASLLSYTVGFMLATLLLHGAGIFVAKLVLFCLTCFLAFVLPNMVQAAQAASGANANFSPLERHTDINQNTFRLQTFDNDYGGSDRLAVDDFNNDYLNLCTDIPDNPDSERHRLKQRTRLISPPQVRTPNQLDHVNAVHWFVNGMDIADLSDSPRYFSLLPEVGPNFAAVFKHYFPDINYTPGSDLLSNGVGLTSPPHVLTAHIPNFAAQFHHTTQLLFIEDHPLQQIYTVFSPALLTKLSAAPCATFLHCVTTSSDNVSTSFAQNTPKSMQS